MYPVLSLSSSPCLRSERFETLTLPWHGLSRCSCHQQLCVGGATAGVASDTSATLFQQCACFRHPARLHPSRKRLLATFTTPTPQSRPLLLVSIYAPIHLQGSTRRYFACGKGGSGSFLKPGKFSVGTSMAEALRQQYVDMNAPLLAPENLLPDAYASTSKGGKKVRHSSSATPCPECQLDDGCFQG